MAPSPHHSPCLSSLERKTHSSEDSLDSTHDTDLTFIPTSDPDDQPFEYADLINLFMAPDMASVLATNDIEIDGLPILLQQVITEVKAEGILQRTQTQPDATPRYPSAVERLERLRRYVWSTSGHDPGMAGRILDELAHNDDELIHVLQ